MIQRKLGILLFLPFLLLACKDEEDPNADYNERLQEQQQEIESYLTDNNIDATLTNGYYLETITENPSGKVPAQNDAVVVYYELQTLEGELVSRVSRSAGDEPDVVPFIQGRVLLPLALYEVIGDMRAGEEVRVFLPFDRAYVSYELPSVFPAFSPMILQIEVDDVLSPAAFKLREDEKIKEYLAENNLQPADSLRSGVYYHETQAGEAPEVESTSTVRVRYAGSLLDGTKFDDNTGPNDDPLRVIMSQDGVIPGFKTALLAMSQLEEGTTIIPSDQGYGPNYYAIPFTVMSELIAQGLVPGQAALGAYASLRFDLEVEAVN